MHNGLKITNYIGSILAVIGLFLAIAGLIYIKVTDNINKIFWGLSIGGLALILTGILMVVIAHWKVVGSTINEEVILRLSPESYQKLNGYFVTNSTK